MHSKGLAAAVGRDDSLDLAADIWMLGAADAALFGRSMLGAGPSMRGELTARVSSLGSRSSLSHWVGRAPPSDDLWGSFRFSTHLALTSPRSPSHLLLRITTPFGI